MKALRKMFHDGGLSKTTAMFDMDDPETGAIFWSGDEGFVLKLPDLDEGDEVPIPLYLLGICFMRLHQDPDFAQELLTWNKRKPH